MILKINNHAGKLILRFGLIISTGLTLWGCAPSMEPEQTAEQRPDLSGIWQTNNPANYNLEPHEGRPGIPPGLGVVQGGKIPYKPEALKQRDENYKNRKQADPLSKCFMPGVPRVTYVELPFQIFQGEDHVLIAYEYAHTFRMIPTDGSDYKYEGVEFWMGESRGHYEGGDTLVVETRHLTGNTWFDRAGNFHSPELKVTERFKKVGPDLIMYEATMDDPKTFTAPWTISMPIYRRVDKDMQLLEYECYSFPGFNPPTESPETETSETGTTESVTSETESTVKGK